MPEPDNDFANKLLLLCETEPTYPLGGGEVEDYSNPYETLIGTLSLEEE